MHDTQTQPKAPGPAWVVLFLAAVLFWVGFAAMCLHLWGDNL